MEYLLRRATLLGFRRGLTGSRMWIAIGITAVGVRMLRKMANAEPLVLYRTKLEPGDRFALDVHEV